MLTDDYRVRLEAFEGPLDLLLHVIRRAEVDVTDIPISRIADEYLEHVRGLEHVDVDLAGEFLVMAATLMEMKSRSLMPPEDGEIRQGRSKERDDEDPRTALIRKLLEYREFKDLGAALDARRQAWQERWPLARIGVDRDAVREAMPPEDLDPEDVNIMDLVEAYERISRAVNFDRIGEHQVLFNDTPIELHATDLMDRLNRLRAGAEAGARVALTLAEIFKGANVTDRIGLFLACLELTRQGKVRIEQDDLAGEVSVVRRDDVGEPASAQSADEPREA